MPYDAVRFRADFDRAWRELRPHVGKGVRAPFAVAFVTAGALASSTPLKKVPRKVSKPVLAEFGNYALLMLHVAWFLTQVAFFSIRLVLKKW